MAGSGGASQKVLSPGTVLGTGTVDTTRRVSVQVDAAEASHSLQQHAHGMRYEKCQSNPFSARSRGPNVAHAAQATAPQLLSR